VVDFTGVERGLSQGDTAFGARAVGAVSREIAGFDAETRGEPFGSRGHAQAAVLEQLPQRFADTLPAGFVGRRTDERDRARRSPNSVRAWQNAACRAG
jgi:hypothetical protein